MATFMFTRAPECLHYPPGVMRGGFHSFSTSLPIWGGLPCKIRWGSVHGMQVQPALRGRDYYNLFLGGMGALPPPRHRLHRTGSSHLVNFEELYVFTHTDVVTPVNPAKRSDTIMSWDYLCAQ